ncbi:MAG: hypothetical protein ACJ8E8_01995 [Sphingomicrobium sp.]
MPIPIMALLLMQSAPAPPPACIRPEHRQFDFWVGRWEVYPTGKERVVAHSLIEKLYDGCVIRENWMPVKGTAGGSLNSYSPDSKQWRQVWADSANGWATLEGGIENGAMVLSGEWKNINGPGTRAFTRTTWSRNPDGSVRQLGEAQNADGKTWSTTFDFTYRPSPASNP